jgi:hypothetical protein
MTRVDLRALLETIWPRKLSILLTGLVFAALAFLVVGIVPVRYTSTGFLMLDAPKDQAAEAMTRITDIDVLLSPSLLNEVATVTGLYHRKDLVPALRLPEGLTGGLPKTVLGYNTNALLGGTPAAAHPGGSASGRNFSDRMDAVIFRFARR